MESFEAKKASSEKCCDEAKNLLPGFCFFFLLLKLCHRKEQTRIFRTKVNIYFPFHAELLDVAKFQDFCFSFALLKIAFVLLTLCDDIGGYFKGMKVSGTKFEALTIVY